MVPLGTVFGIKLFTDGVIVASLSDLYTSNGVCCPAAEAGILPGDYLLEADGMEIPSNQSLAEYIGQSAGEAITFQVRRGEQVFETQVTPCMEKVLLKPACGCGTARGHWHPDLLRSIHWLLCRAGARHLRHGYQRRDDAETGSPCPLPSAA